MVCWLLGWSVCLLACFLACLLACLVGWLVGGGLVGWFVCLIGWSFEGAPGVLFLSKGQRKKKPAYCLLHVAVGHEPILMFEGRNLCKPNAGAALFAAPEYVNLD